MAQNTVMDHLQKLCRSSLVRVAFLLSTFSPSSLWLRVKLGEIDNSEGYACDLPQTFVLKQGETSLEMVQSFN